MHTSIRNICNTRASSIGKNDPSKLCPPLILPPSGTGSYSLLFLSSLEENEVHDVSPPLPMLCVCECVDEYQNKTCHQGQMKIFSNHTEKYVM